MKNLLLYLFLLAGFVSHAQAIKPPIIVNGNTPQAIPAWQISNQFDTYGFGQYIPDQDTTYSIGATSRRAKNVYAKRFISYAPSSYNANYSSQFTSLSFVHKGYVDSVMANIPSGGGTSTGISPETQNALNGKQNTINLTGGLMWGLGSGSFRLANLGTEYSNQITAGKQISDTIKKYNLFDSLGLDVTAPGKHVLFRKDSLTIGSRGLADGADYSWTYPTPTTIGLNLSSSNIIRDTVPTIGSNNGVTSDAVATALVDKASLSTDNAFTKNLTLGSSIVNTSSKLYVVTGITKLATFESLHSLGGYINLVRSTLPTGANQRISELLFGTTSQATSGVLGFYSDSAHTAGVSLPTDFAIRLTHKNTVNTAEVLRINSDGATNINGTLSVTPPDDADSSNLVPTTGGLKRALKNVSTASFSGSYMLNPSLGNSSLAASAYYYFGASGASNSGTGYTKMYIGRSGVIKKVVVVFWNGGTLSSAETGSLYLRVVTPTGATFYNIASDVTCNAVQKTYSTITLNNGAGVPVTGNWTDYIEMQLVTPAWVTTPTSVRITATVEVDY